MKTLRVGAESFLFQEGEVLRSWEDPLAMSISEKCGVGSPIRERPEKVRGQDVLTSASHAFFIFSSVCLDYMFFGVKVYLLL